ncbi:MAG: NAD(P)-dependent oxidoreductase [Cyclobacteriaceae bacterium]
MNQNSRILIADKMHESIMPLLKEAGFTPEYAPDITREKILSSISDYSGLIIRSKTVVDKELIDKGERLKFVARAGAGLDQLDSAYLEEKGIKVINAPEGNRDAVGEHALGMLLNLLNNISKANQEVKSGIWDREGNRGYELNGKVVGIYGYGNAGKSFAKKLSGLECSVLAYDKYKNGFSENTVTEVDLNEFRRRVEILSIHIPLTGETQFLFSKAELDLYPKLKIILNTARGEVLKLADVLEMIRDKRLIRLGLDVLEKETIASLAGPDKEILEELAKSDHVIFTPHVAGWTVESYQKISQVLAEKILALDLLQ